MLRLYAFITSTTSLLLLIRYGGAAAGFLTQLALARILSPESLGLFFAAISLAAVSSTIATFGYPEIAPRFISRYRTRGRLRLFADFVDYSRRDSLRLCTAMSGLIVVGAVFWPDASRQESFVFILTALWLPILASLYINSGIALSLRAFFLAYSPENFLTPVGFLIVVATLVLFGQRSDVLILLAAIVTISSGLTFGQWMLLRPLLPQGQETTANPTDPRNVRRWRREGAPQIAVSIYTMLFADITILLTAIVLSRSELAAFAIALKLAMLVGFAVQVVHQVIIPDLADAQAERRLGQTGDTMRKAAIFPLVFTLAALVAAMLLGDIALALFHPDFVQAHNVLVLLVGCQVLRALSGPVVQLLTTAGAQLENALICIASTLFLGLGIFVFVNSFGIIGAAYAVVVAWIFWLTLSSIALYRITGLRCDILSLTGMTTFTRNVT